MTRASKIYWFFCHLTLFLPGNRPTRSWTLLPPGRKIFRVAMNTIISGFIVFLREPQRTQIQLQNPRISERGETEKRRVWQTRPDSYKINNSWLSRNGSRNQPQPQSLACQGKDFRAWGREFITSLHISHLCCQIKPPPVHSGLSQAGITLLWWQWQLLCSKPSREHECL